MVPSSVILMDALPLTPAGKVDVNALPIPGPSHLEMEAGYVAPRTALEKQLADLWASVLGVEKVGVYDSFFELGGHSLLATQLASRVRQQLGVEVPLRSLFESPTIASLAPIVIQLRGEERPDVYSPAEQTVASEQDEEELARLLDELENLSDDEARERLGREHGDD